MTAEKPTDPREDVKIGCPQNSKKRGARESQIDRYNPKYPEPLPKKIIC